MEVKTMAAKVEVKTMVAKVEVKTMAANSATMGAAVDQAKEKEEEVAATAAAVLRKLRPSRQVKANKNRKTNCQLINHITRTEYIYVPCTFLFPFKVLYLCMYAYL